MSLARQVEVTKGNAEEVAGFLAKEVSESAWNASNVEAVANILMNIINARVCDKEVRSRQTSNTTIIHSASGRKVPLVSP